MRSISCNGQTVGHYSTDYFDDNKDDTEDTGGDELPAGHLIHALMSTGLVTVVPQVGHFSRWGDTEPFQFIAVTAIRPVTALLRGASMYAVDHPGFSIANHTGESWAVTGAPVGLYFAAEGSTGLVGLNLAMEIATHTTNSFALPFSMTTALGWTQLTKESGSENAAGQTKEATRRR